MPVSFLVFVSVFLASAQQPEVRYKLRTPVNWQVWVRNPSSDGAVSGYTFANDRDERSYIEEKIRKGQYVTYRLGDLAVSHEQRNETCFITIVEGENRGSEGWVHTALMEMTSESKAYLEKKRAADERVEADRRAAAERAAATKKRAAEDAKRKELAYKNSLPKLVSQGESVIVATSMDCAKDLQSVVGFGKKNGGNHANVHWPSALFAPTLKFTFLQCARPHFRQISPDSGFN